MHIVSYNVNGIRSATGKGLLNWMEHRQADVYCFQEVKAEASQLDLRPFELLGYKSYWFPAVKKGYSGVAIFTKLIPDHVEYGCGDADWDAEGRIIRADFGDLSVMSVYMPSGSSGEVRQAYKMDWLQHFHGYIGNVRQERPQLVVCGDYNICHRAIDIHDPVSNRNSSGFLLEERAWMDRFTESGFTDTFRHLYPDDAHQYSWWTFRANARARNKGWRIDYCMTTENISARIKGAGIHPEAKHSDHCPVWVEINS